VPRFYSSTVSNALRIKLNTSPTRLTTKQEAGLDPMPKHQSMMDSLVGISDYATGWTNGVLLLVGREIFLFVTLPTLDLGAASLLLAKRQFRVADHLSASSAEANTCTSSWPDAQLGTWIIVWY
jgi:hypothetical protein